MANEVVCIPPSLHLVSPKVKGLDEFSDRDLKREPGILKITYARSRNDAGRSGDLRLGEAIYPGDEGLYVVILKGHHFRSLLEGPEEKPYTVCASNDGHRPHDQVPNPKAPVCGDPCPYGQWKDGPGGKRKPPECQQGVALLGVLAKTGDPFWFLLRKGARQIGMQLAQAIQSRGTQRFSDWVVKVSTVEKRNEGVVWYEPAFQIIGPTPQGMYNDLSDEVAPLRYTPAISPRAQTPEPGPTDDGSTDTWEIPV